MVIIFIIIIVDIIIFIINPHYNKFSRNIFLSVFPTAKCLEKIQYKLLTGELDCEAQCPTPCR